jgi:hypothetical protein
MGNEAHSAFGYVRSELHRPSPCTDGKAVVPIQFEADETNCRGESDKAELSSTMRRNTPYARADCVVRVRMP